MGSALASPVDLARAGESGEARVRVYIISDVELVCEGLHAQLMRDPGLSVVGASAPDERACLAIAANPVDAVVVDFGAAAAPAFVARLRADGTGCRIVGIAIGKSGRTPADWAAAGVRGFVDDNGTINDVVRTVIGVAQGHFCCSPHTASEVVQGLIARPTEPPRLARSAIAARLTPRERDILAGIERGASNKEIARTLGISAATVKNHVHHLLEKLDVSRRSQAAALLHQY